MIFVCAVKDALSLITCSSPNRNEAGFKMSLSAKRTSFPPVVQLQQNWNEPLNKFKNLDPS